MRAVAFLSGLLFALGLGLSQMTNPVKVTAFLDFFGSWDPSLALVMAGAIGVNLVPTLLSMRRERPVLGLRYHLTALTEVDAPLIGGAALFGLGWGLAGYCPGPALVATAGGVGQAALFTLGMVGGMSLFHAMSGRLVDEPDLVAAKAPGAG